MLWRLILFPLILISIFLSLTGFLSGLLGQQERQHYSELRAASLEITKFKTRESFNDFILQVQSASEFYAQIHRQIEAELLQDTAVQLEDLKSDYSDRLGYQVDIYRVNSDYVIYDTTFAPDLGLDFKGASFTDAQATLNKARLTSAVLVGMPNQEISSGDYKLYTVSKLPADQGFLQIGFTDFAIADRFNKLQANLESHAAILSAQLLLRSPNGYLARLSALESDDRSSLSKEELLAKHETELLEDRRLLQMLVDESINFFEQEPDRSGESFFYLRLNDVDLTENYTYQYWIKLKTNLPPLSWLASNATLLSTLATSATFLMLFGYAFWINNSIVSPLKKLSYSLRGGRRLDDEGVKKNVHRELRQVINSFHAHLDRSSELAKELRQEAITDELTGLYNRKVLSTIHDRLMKIARRTQHFVGVLYIDLDHFKEFNDLYGHAEGDAALKALADVMAQEFQRPTDAIIRIGGEEFVIYFETDHPDRAKDMAERTRNALIKRDLTHEGNGPLGVLTLSAGLVVADPDNDPLDMETFLKVADEALYEAKSEGRNRIVTVTYNRTDSRETVHEDCSESATRVPA